MSRYSTNRTADELLDAISALRRALRRGAARPAELASLTGAQAELVRLLRRRPGSSIAQAAADLRLAPNTVSTLVGQLLAAGVIDRSVDAGDRRVARLDLAPGIRRTVEAWRDRRVDVLHAALAALNPGDRAAVERALPALGQLSAYVTDAVEAAA